MGEEQLENTVSILIKESQIEETGVYYLILYYPFFQVRKTVRLVGTCKPYVSQVIVSQTTGRGVSDTSK